MQTVIILGSTGSIGTQTLEVISRHTDKFQVLALSAGSNAHLLAEQALTHRVKFLALADETKGDILVQLIEKLAQESGVKYQPEAIFLGQTAAEKLAGLDSSATVVNGITGAIGLVPTLCALENGSKLALANKESLVVGADLVRRAQKYPAQVVPVDSEHSAIAQALLAGKHNKGMCAKIVDGTTEVDKIILTASGGPFRNYDRQQLQQVTAKDALKHPTWNMGAVVTINSSTLMNKALELIEAHVLFDVAAKDIQPVVHPQSVVHSMVAYKDGSVIAQASYPNMILPIALGLSTTDTIPNRLDNIVDIYDFSKACSWDFEPVNTELFPAIEVAKSALQASSTHPCVMNAANEVCVDKFLSGKISYLDIVDTVIKVLNEYQGVDEVDLEKLKQIDSWARLKANELIK